ncbi:MAG: hypothetical protein AAF750_03180 [Planctomycetota bacterium]
MTTDEARRQSRSPEIKRGLSKRHRWWIKAILVGISLAVIVITVYWLVAIPQGWGYRPHSTWAAYLQTIFLFTVSLLVGIKLYDITISARDMYSNIGWDDSDTPDHKA